MKLTIEHLACYLPYGLQCQWKRSDGKTITNTLTVSDYDFLVRKIEFKPLLRPMAEISEDEYMEVFKAGMDDDILESFTKHHDLAVHIFGEVARLYDKKVGFLLWLPKSHLISYHNCNFGQSWGFRFNQYKAYQKLFSLHADVFGLIEQNLALQKQAQ